MAHHHRRMLTPKERAMAKELVARLAQGDEDRRRARAVSQEKEQSRWGVARAACAKEDGGPAHDEPGKRAWNSSLAAKAYLVDTLGEAPATGLLSRLKTGEMAGDFGRDVTRMNKARAHIGNALRAVKAAAELLDGTDPLFRRWDPDLLESARGALRELDSHLEQGTGQGTEWQAGAEFFERPFRNLRSRKAPGAAERQRTLARIVEGGLRWRRDALAEGHKRERLTGTLFALAMIAAGVERCTTQEAFEALRQRWVRALRRDRG